MMKKVFFLPFALIFLLSAFPASAQETAVGDSIILLIRNSNAKGLARLFNASIQLSTPSNDGRFSKNQAEMIISDFFTKYPPKSVTLNHQGASNDGSLYYIGNYKSGSSNYRIYFLLKRVNGVFLLHQLRFETDD